MVSWFQAGGPFMYLVLLVDVLAVPALVFALGAAIAGRLVPVLLWPARVITVLVLLFTMGAGCAGGVGWLQGRRVTDQAIAYASPEYAEPLRAAGYAEARVPGVFGAVSTLALFLPALAIALATVPPSRSPNADGPPP